MEGKWRQRRWKASPQAIMDEIVTLDAEAAVVLGTIAKLLKVGTGDAS